MEAMVEAKLNKYGNLPLLPRREVEKFLKDKHNKETYPFIYLMLEHNSKVKGSYMIAGELEE